MSISQVSGPVSGVSELGMLSFFAPTAESFGVSA